MVPVSRKNLWPDFFSWFWIQIFLFPNRLFAKLKKHILSDHLIISNGIIHGFMIFLGALVWKETQTALSRSWTWLIEFIFYAHKYHAKHTSIYIYIYIYRERERGRERWQTTEWKWLKIWNTFSSQSRDPKTTRIKPPKNNNQTKSYKQNRPMQFSRINQNPK